MGFLQFLKDLIDIDLTEQVPDTQTYLGYKERERYYNMLIGEYGYTHEEAMKVLGKMGDNKDGPKRKAQD